MSRVKHTPPSPRPAETPAQPPAPAATPAASPHPVNSLKMAPAFAAGSTYQSGTPKTNPATQVPTMGPATPPPSSALHFDANLPDVQTFAASKGWNLPGQKVGIIKADLVYTTDNWKTTKTAPLQYLYNNSQGFILRDVPPGTKVEYAVHAEVGVSHNGFYSYDDRADVWFNNNNQNYHASSGDVTGY